ncbi:arylalkylamine N-acetyltransferase 1-like isoform X1 [Armigeres subalbatus]|uniref:arylalkylamine N-acetyltransferase 1-like isoform X1 n=1 Tax=Armigeres subalbatus TaxID=124917 RepID=UPI002ECFED3D
MFRRLKIPCNQLSYASDLLKKKFLYSLQLEANADADKWNQKRGQGVFTLSFLYKQDIPRPFSIRLAKSQDEPHIMHFIRENFYNEEPLIKSLNINKSVANPCLESYLCNHLKSGFTLIAVEKDNRIVGISVNQRNCAWDGDRLREQADRVQCDPLRKLFYIWSIISKEPRLHQKFNTSCIFEIAILATAREAQRQGIGYQLTLHSLRLARDLGFDVARMDCTNEYSSRLAKRAGMECMWSVPYKHLVDSDKNPVVKPEDPHTHIRVHATHLKGA